MGDGFEEFEGQTDDTLLEKISDLLSTNRYLIAIGWIFTVSGGIIAFSTVNAVLGIIILILFSFFLIVVPKKVPTKGVQSSKDDVQDSVVESQAFILSTSIPPCTDLIGREEDTINILDDLEHFSIVSIHAGGGVGKTAVAAKIANDIKNEIVSGKSPFEHIAWITSSGNLKKDLTGLDIPSVMVARTLDEKLSALRKYLDGTLTLLVIDNMDEPPTVDEEELMNTISGNTKILITTRADIPISKKYDLNLLDPDAALILFYRHFKRVAALNIEQIKEQDDVLFAEKIVSATSYNALFIELIGKMAYADHWKLADLWERHKDDIFDQDSKHEVRTGHGKSHPENRGRLLTQIKKLYEMSNLSECQKDIMSFIALFPAEHSIFFDVFKWAGFEDDKVDNMGELQDRGWIERDDNGYLIHTMVKGSITLQSGEAVFDEERYKYLVDELSDTDKYMPEGTVYTRVKELIVVPETVCRLLVKKGSEKENSARLYYNLATVYYSQGNYDDALYFYNKTLFIRENVLGLDHPDTASTYNKIAIVYRAQGNYDDALAFYKTALAIREKVLGFEHPDTASTYNNIAIVYRIQGNYDDALKFYKKALVIREKVLGFEHPDTASTYNNMAVVYRAQGNNQEAQKFFEKALAIREKVLGLEHPDTASTYNNMANMFFDLGNYDEALKNYEKDRAINETVLGLEHPDTAATYNNIANVYRAKGNIEEAQNYYEKALKVFTMKLGADHPYTKAVKKDLEDLSL